MLFYFRIIQIGDDETTVNSKFLSLCGCLFLAAVFGVVGAAGGIYAYRQLNDALVPQLAAQIAMLLEKEKKALPIKIEQRDDEARASLSKGNNEKETKSGTQPELPLYYWDLDRVMSQSKAGKMLTDYAAKYAQVMENNAAALRKALKKDDKSPKAEEARAMIAQFEKRRSAAEIDARAFVRRLVAKELQEEPRFANAYVIDDANTFMFAPVSADVSTFLIEQLNEVNLNLPQLPRSVELQHNNAVSEKNNLKEKKK